MFVKESPIIIFEPEKLYFARLSRNYGNLVPGPQCSEVIKYIALRESRALLSFPGTIPFAYARAPVA